MCHEGVRRELQLLETEESINANSLIFLMDFMTFQDNHFCHLNNSSSFLDPVPCSLVQNVTASQAFGALNPRAHCENHTEAGFRIFALQGLVMGIFERVFERVKYIYF